MNHLPVVEEDAWQLPQHAHIVVYDADAGDQLLTIYDCGAAQKPPSARLIGRLQVVGVDHEREETPTGAVVRLRQPAVLARDGESYRIVPR
jgi:hypothetical protein